MLDFDGIGVEGRIFKVMGMEVFFLGGGMKMFWN